MSVTADPEGVVPSTSQDRFAGSRGESSRWPTRARSLDVEAAFRRPPKVRGRVLFWVAIAWVSLMILLAIFANLLPLHRYDLLVTSLSPSTAPGWRAEFLGTDSTGRSVLSRIIFGARESMLVSVLAASLTFVVGLAIGVVAGFFRGKVDAVISVVLDAVLAIPSLILLIAIASVGRSGTATLVVSLGIVGIPSVARLARAATLALADRDYIVAARVMGATNVRIIVRELLPEIVLRVSSFVFLLMALFLVAEGSLSYLGLGVPPPTPSWGGMIADGQSYLSTQPYLILVPTAFLFLTVYSFTVIGDRARRHFDSRESGLQ